MNRHRPVHSESGIALIMVMVVVVALGIMAAHFSFSMKIETRLAINTTRDPDMEWMGRSGVELAKYVLAEKMRIPIENQFDALNQMWAGGPFGTNEVLAAISLQGVPLGDGIINVKIEDLERRFNVNVHGPVITSQALLFMGVEPFQASVILDSLKDWVDPDIITRLNGADEESYLTEPNSPFPPYLVKNGFIDDLSELLLIKGITPEIFYGFQAAENPLMPTGMGSANFGLSDLFTTVGGYQVNINTASASVLQMIPGMDENLAFEIVMTRAGFDGVDGTEDDLPFTRIQDLMMVPSITPPVLQSMRRFVTHRSNTFEIIVEARIDNYRRIFRALIVRLNGRQFATLNMRWE
ncbi:MAG: type II secretion system protein GspK [Verrucomicrobiota bacterium]|nr:type II secretion system protein GspK [Verrucomicrobiota bacterium]